jgi:hypothetical protein
VTESTPDDELAPPTDALAHDDPAEDQALAFDDRYWAPEGDAAPPCGPPAIDDRDSAPEGDAAPVSGPPAIDDRSPDREGGPERDDAAAVMEPVVEPAPVLRRRAVLAPAAPDADRHVAHVLLRSGSVLPARVHLETLAGRRQLDLPGLLDLAESRWRTGDLGGAGEAVAAYLEAGGEAPLGFLIAAEATSAMGRPGEARKLARRALEDLTEPLDAVFAGQRRSGIWPHDPAAPPQPAATLFAGPATEAARGGRIGLTADPRPPVPTIPTGHTPPPPPPAGPASAATDAEPLAEAATPSAETQPDRSLWDAEPAAPTPAQLELDAARAALDAGDPHAAAVRLAIVLRLSPALAPLVLDLVGQLPGPDFDLLRGDALRLVGHEAAAERAFAAAADALREQQRPSRSPE